MITPHLRRVDVLYGFTQRDRQNGYLRIQVKTLSLLGLLCKKKHFVYYIIITIFYFI